MGLVFFFLRRRNRQARRPPVLYVGFPAFYLALADTAPNTPSDR